MNICKTKPPQSFQSVKLLIIKFVIYNVIIYIKHFAKCDFPTTHSPRPNMINKLWQKILYLDLDVDIYCFIQYRHLNNLP